MIKMDKLIEVIKSMDYGEIKITITNGQIKFIEKIEKIKV